MPNANTLLNNGYKILNNSLCRSSKLDAEVLLSSVLKKKIEEIVLTRSIPISKEDETNYQRLIFRRKQGEPIAYILNKKEFWKNTFYVNKNVLIPRPDTEVIVEEAIKLIDKTKQKLILDIGTGSGCIIISLLKERPNIIGSAIDISKKAIKVAKINAKIHHLTNRIKFYNSSVDNFFTGKYDLIISNPPYIKDYKIKYLDKDINSFEPLVSLKGGPNGSSVLNKVIKKSSNLIKVGGKLVLEIGYDQKYIVMDLLKREGFYINKLVKDYANNDRCIIATKL